MNEDIINITEEKMLKAVAFQTVFAWVIATIVYQVGSRIEKGTLNVADIILIAIIVLVVGIILFRNNKKKECAGCPYCDSCDK